MQLVTTAVALRAAVAARRADDHRIGFVPTLGGLHAGHLSNVRIAAGQADTVVVSIFLNPTQFDRPEDLAGYPHDLDTDVAALRELGAAAPAIVFAPSAQEMYPRELLTTVHVAALTEGLEGVSRPGHFDAVATVVTKLCNLVQPDVAVFGRKDFQQLQVVRRLVADLDLPITIIDAPTVRDRDGLALSSRNARLAPTDRTAARSLSRALRNAVVAGRRERDQGRAPDPDVLRDAGMAAFTDQPGVELDYLVVVDPDTLTPPAGAPPGTGGAERRLLVAVAATVGPVRLIDNVEVGDPADEQLLLDAVPTNDGGAVG